MYYLTNIQLDYNQFTGPLEIKNISSSPLMSISLNGNNLNGQIPLSVSEFPNLERLSVDSNDISGTLNLDIYSRSTVSLGTFIFQIIINKTLTGSGMIKFHSSQ
ncbi:LRR domain containing protein, partial [Trema orientale]